MAPEHGGLALLGTAVIGHGERCAITGARVRSLTSYHMYPIEMHIREAIIILVTFVTFVMVGCAHRRPAASSPTQKPASATGSALLGMVDLQFLPDPNAPKPNLDEHQEFIHPDVLSGTLRLPEFPADALAARAGPAYVVVRIVIDTLGRVAGVGDSPVQSSSSDPFGQSYRDAVLRALRHWRFSPGAIRRWEEGKDFDGDGNPDERDILSVNAVKVFYDVRFDFEIVKGEGRVRAGASQKP